MTLQNQKGDPWTVIVDRWIYRNTRLTPAARIFAIYVSDESKKKTKKSIDTLEVAAKRCGLAERTIRAARAELVDAGVLDRHGLHKHMPLPPGHGGFVASDWRLLGGDLRPSDRLVLLYLDDLRSSLREHATKDHGPSAEPWRWEVLRAGSDAIRSAIGFGKEQACTSIDRLHERGAITKIARPNTSALLVLNHRHVPSSLSLAAEIDARIEAEQRQVADVVSVMTATTGYAPRIEGGRLIFRGDEEQREEAFAYARGLVGFEALRAFLLGQPVMDRERAEEDVRRHHVTLLAAAHDRAQELVGAWQAAHPPKPAPAARRPAPPPTGPKAPRRKPTHAGTYRRRDAAVPVDDPSSSRESPEDLTNGALVTALHQSPNPLADNTSSGINPTADCADTGHIRKSDPATTALDSGEFPIGMLLEEATGRAASTRPPPGINPTAKRHKPDRGGGINPTGSKTVLYDSRDVEADRARTRPPPRFAPDRTAGTPKLIAKVHAAREVERLRGRGRSA